MKRIIAALLAAVLFLGACTACSSIGGNSRIVGTWKLTKAKIGGIEVSADKFGVNVSFTFEKDGSCSVTGLQQGQPLKNVKWSFDGSTVKIGTDKLNVIEMEYQNGMLKMIESRSGVEMTFEKQN